MLCSEFKGIKKYALWWHNASSFVLELWSCPVSERGIWEVLLRRLVHCSICKYSWLFSVQCIVTVCKCSCLFSVQCSVVYVRCGKKKPQFILVNVCYWKITVVPIDCNAVRFLHSAKSSLKPFSGMRLGRPTLWYGPLRAPRCHNVFLEWKCSGHRKVTTSEIWRMGWMFQSCDCLLEQKFLHS